MNHATITVFGAANVTYSGFTETRKVKIEYKHSGPIKYREHGKRKYKHSQGYYYIDRIAIPSITANGKRDWWYITNDGDSYVVNKVSKYLKRIHEQMSKEQPLKTLNQ